MEVVPLTVGAAARAWDEQHLDVSAAAGQIGGASSGGFTDAVAGTASRFATTWQRHAEDLAGQAEAQADGLRSAIDDDLSTDRAVGYHALALKASLVEIR